MKKLLLITAIISTAGVAQAYPNVDMNVGGAPFLLLQQQNFQKMEVNDYKQFKDANEKPASMRLDSPKKLQQEYELKNKKKPAKIQLGSTKSEEPVVNSSDMELINDNGKIRIKYSN